jgi:transaldolase
MVEGKTEVKTYFERVQEQTPTRFWVSATRDQADLAIAYGAVGCTQNPAYTWKMISHETEGGFVLAQLLDILEQETDDNEALVMLQRQVISGVAQRFMPLFGVSGGKKGYVSIQCDSFHEDTDTIVRHARANVAASPNLMAKVPVTMGRWRRVAARAIALQTNA